MLDWGNVPEWVGSVGTVAALLVALGVFVRDSRDRRTRIASRVYARIDAENHCVHATNGSDEPVTRVMVALFVPPEHYAEPQTESNNHPIVWDQDLLAANSEVTFVPDDSEAIEWNAHLYPAQVRMEFTDATGRRWLRDEDNRLRRKHVIPYRRDLKLAVAKHRREKRRTEKYRRIYTRWRWPNV